jgi:uncharacterized membrane protein HdeD (DUF308 family)
MDESTLKNLWGALALRGVVSILFGIVAVFWPGLTLVTLVYLFGAYVLASGLVNLIIGLTNLGGNKGTFWGRLLLMLLGFGEVAVGVYLLRHPLVTFATLILIIGIVLIVRGLFDLFAGVFGEGGATYRTVMIIGGLIAALAGIVLLFQPAASGVAFVWILGLYALVTGPLLVAMAFEAKNS